jgi:putative ABC transport system substrate-binding protein
MKKAAWSSILVAVVLLALGVIAEAQQPAKIPRIGFLSGGSPSTNARAVFRQGLRDLGYVEGKNISIDWRFAEGKLNRLPALAAEIVRLQVDVIVTLGGREPVPPRKRRRRFPSSWRRFPILLGMGSSLALRDLVGTSLDYPRLARS